ncbi:MAG: metallophosphoesterase [Elioraea tepidiphila]
MRLTRRLLLSTGAAALAAPALVRAQAPLRLTVLHTNDVHSRHEPINRLGAACRAEEQQAGSCVGGSARLAAALVAERAAAGAEGRIVLTLDAGDQFMGSLFYTHWRGEAEREVMNAIGYDAMTVGNHEFDNGPPVLARFAASLACPLLSANIDATGEPALAPLIRPFTVIARGGARIGIVGLTTADTPRISSPGPGVRFGEEVAALGTGVQAARAAGAEVVIALTHVGLGLDQRLAAAVPGLSAVVGGHSHTLLSNSADGAEGRYPLPVHGASGFAVPVVQAGANNRYLGRLDLDLDRSGRVLAASGDARELGFADPRHPGVEALVARLAEPLAALRARVIGTLAEGEGRVPVGRAYPEFSLMPTQRGVAVLAWSEHVTLRPADNAFALTAGQTMPRGLAITPGQQGVDLSLATRAPTRSFDIPSLPEAALAERLRLLRAETAAAPPLARARPRMMLAETMLALGFGPEAYAVLALAASEDPVAAASPRWAALAGAAALLAGRPDEARGPLSDPRLDGTDEITLWRAWLAEQTGTPAAVTAPNFAAAAPLLPAYPLPLARRIAPSAAEAMLEGGEIEVADALLARLGELPELALSRAMLMEARGRIDEALAAYEALDRLRDRRQRVRALARAVELGLREGRIGAPEAAARLEPLLYAWRGDAAERALRLRAAELRAQSGDWSGALLLLRETASLFPDRAGDIRARLGEAFAALFRDGAADTMPPVEAIALFEENADLLPPGQAGDEMVARLAERLVALDLTARAGITLQRLMDSQPERGIDRARTGLRLARLKLADGDAAAALAVLGASEPHRPPPALATERLVLRARALAASGDSPGARALLAQSEDPVALDARAELAAQAGDWKDAVAALKVLARSRLPAPGNPLDADQRRMLLRLAVAASLSGDTETLSGLARDHGAAMATGPLSEPFRLLTGGPVRGASDLPRVSAELRLAREMPRILAALATAPRD